MREPLLVPLGLFAIGIGLASSVGFSVWELAGPAIGFLGLAFIAWRWRPRLLRVCILLLIAVIGAVMYQSRRPAPPPVLDAAYDEKVLLTGCVVTPPAFFDGRAQFVLELEPDARVRVNLYPREGEPLPSLAYGQMVEVAGKVRSPHNFGNPGAFDYAGWMARQQIFWTAGASSASVVPGACGTLWQRWLYTLREACVNQLDRVYQGDAWAAAMMKATLIGDTTALRKVWTENFRRTGTYHALVISGMHVTVLAGVLLFLLRFLPLGEFGALSLAVVLAWIYAMLAGFQAPVVRGAGGFTLFLVAKYFYRRARILNILAAIAIGFLAYDPEQLFEPSFQLSFLCVGMIGAFAVPILDATSGPYQKGMRWLEQADADFRLAPPVAQFRIELRLLAETGSLWLRLPQRWVVAVLGWVSRAVLFAWELFLLSAVIQFGLALPMILYFHRLSWTGLAANLVVVPLMSVVVPVGFVAMLTGWILPAKAAWGCLWLARWIVDWFARAEAGMRIPDPPIWLSAAFAISLVTLFAAVRTRRWRVPALAAAGGLFATLLIHPLAPRVQRGTLELTAIDVGQGESLLVALPDGKLMLVDGGGIPTFGKHPRARMDIGEDVVSPYLWRRSIKHLDVVVSTHGHDDHVGGLPALMENFHPAELWTGATAAGPPWDGLFESARRNGLRVVPRRAGEVLDYGGVHIQVLAPAPDYEPGEMPHNNDSLVLRLAYGKHSFLLTGDAEHRVEDTLTLERTDVLKVAHHGSRTSSTPELLDVVQPAFAVISAGYQNSYHLPHASVLRELEARHAETLRTDMDGLITIRTDGRRFQVEKYRDTEGSSRYGLWAPD